MRDAAVYIGLFEKIALEGQKLRTWAPEDIPALAQHRIENPTSQFAEQIQTGDKTRYGSFTPADAATIRKRPVPGMFDLQGRAKELAIGTMNDPETRMFANIRAKDMGGAAAEGALTTAKQDPAGKALISGAETLQKGKDMLSGWGDLINFKGAGIGGLLGMALMLLLSRGKIGMGILGLLGGGALGGFGGQYALKNRENISGYLGQNAAPLKGPFDWSMDKLAPAKPVVPPVSGQR